jgi:PTH2 family peptidyl-tRNA hydrolase
MNTKQVIVMRTKYLDANGKTFSLRRGKEIAQASHASLSFLTRRMNSKGEMEKPLTKAQVNWLNNSYAKVTVKVTSEEELMEIHDKAVEAGLEVHLVTDSGRTEFHGVATKTCLAIGPDDVTKIDAVTGHLPLL